MQTFNTPIPFMDLILLLIFLTLPTDLHSFYTVGALHKKVFLLLINTFILDDLFF